MDHSDGWWYEICKVEDAIRIRECTERHNGESHERYIFMENIDEFIQALIKAKDD